MIKKTLALVLASVFALAITGCEEKSEIDKAADSVSSAFEKSKDAINDATK
ncbi:MAG: hypothetical protein WA945_03455 [Arcobacteraceae bacterium]